MKLIISGTVEQGRSYAREQGWQPQECVIATTPEAVRGAKFTEIRKVGSWWKLADIDTILYEASLSQPCACTECGGCGFLEDFDTMNIKGQCPACNGSGIAAKPQLEAP